MKQTIEMLKKFPLLLKLESFLEDIKNTKKLYSKKAIAKMTYSNVDTVRQLLYSVLDEKDWLGRIIIDGKMYYGNKKIIKSIKEKLVE